MSLLKYFITKSLNYSSLPITYYFFYPLAFFIMILTTVTFIEDNFFIFLSPKIFKNMFHNQYDLERPSKLVILIIQSHFGG